jgi:hypothetical protein
MVLNGLPDIPTLSLGNGCLCAGEVITIAQELVM